VFVIVTPQPQVYLHLQLYLMGFCFLLVCFIVGSVNSILNLTTENWKGKTKSWNEEERGCKDDKRQ